MTDLVSPDQLWGSLLKLLLLSRFPDVIAGGKNSPEDADDEGTVGHR